MTPIPVGHAEGLMRPESRVVGHAMPALVHAAKIATRTGAQLHVTDIVRKMGANHERAVRADVDALTDAWHRAGSRPIALSSGQLRCGPGSERGLLAALAATSADLLVLDREERWESERLTNDALLARLVQRAPLPTLVVGRGGLVGVRDGRSHLSRVIIPVRSQRGMRQVLDVAAWVARALSDQPVPIVLLQVDAQNAHAPLVDVDPSLSVRITSRRGPLINALQDELGTRSADLLVLPLGAEEDGWNTTLDILRVEALLERLDCAILGVPVRPRGDAQAFGSGYGLRVEAVRSP